MCILPQVGLTQELGCLTLRAEASDIPVRKTRADGANPVPQVRDLSSLGQMQPILRAKKEGAYEKGRKAFQVIRKLQKNNILSSEVQINRKTHGLHFSKNTHSSEIHRGGGIC